MTNISEVISGSEDEATAAAQQQRIDAIAESLTPEQLGLVASHFCADIRNYVGDEAFAEIAARNAARQPGDMDVCHTHDFCDANVFMSEAFKKVLSRVGLQFDPAYEVMVDPGPWGQAWAIAQRLFPEIAAAQPSPSPKQ